MKKKDILLKFQSNNNKLETVLYKKKLAGDVKNLLLSMLYNITNSYGDYANIKVNVENKNQYIEKIIGIIEKCHNIEIVSPNSEEGKKILEENMHCMVDTYFKTIKVFGAERDMLYALFKMNDTKMYLDEKYNLLRVAIPEMLNEGRDINNIEIIRDFNAWSWNTVSKDISNIDCNLIYQNLLMLLGFDFLESWMQQENQKEQLEKLEQELKKQYNSKNIQELLDYICRLSIIVCIERNKNEKKRLIDEKEWDEKELQRMQDKNALVEELTKTKKEKQKEIGKLDEIINNEDLLKKEFEERNKNLAEYKKIYSVENLLGTLKRERNKALNEIEECNKLLDAKSYVKRKEELEENLKLLKEIKTPKNKEKYKIKIQKLFIKCLEQNIEKIEAPEQKKRAIALLRMVRYYNFVLFDENIYIKDIGELREDLDSLEGKILLKLFEIKALNPITKDLETDVGITKPILSTRIVELENVNLQVKKQENKIEIKVYDGNILELEFRIENLNGVELKGKKKVKLFAK